MFDRWVEDGLLDVLADEGIGCIVFSPLAQGLLTNRYLGGIPDGSRAAKSYSYLSREDLTPPVMAKVRALNEIAVERGQTLAQMAVAWVLRHPAVTSALVGASSPRQVEDIVAALDHLPFGPEELERIEAILGG